MVRADLRGESLGSCYLLAHEGLYEITNARTRASLRSTVDSTHVRTVQDPGDNFLGRLRHEVLDSGDST